MNAVNQYINYHHSIIVNYSETKTKTKSEVNFLSLMVSQVAFRILLLVRDCFCSNKDKKRIRSKLSRYQVDAEASKLARTVFPITGLDVKNTLGFIDFLNSLKRFPRTQRKEVINGIQELMKLGIVNGMTENFKISYLRFLLLTPSKDRPQMMELAKDLVKEFNSYDKVVEVLKSVSQVEISEVDNKQLMQVISPLYKCPNNLLILEKYFPLLIEMSKTSRNRLVNSLLPFFNIKNNKDNINYLLEDLTGIPFNERVSTLKTLGKIFKNRQEYRYGSCYLDHLLNCPFKKRELLIGKINALLVNEDDPNKICELISSFADFFKEEGGIRKEIYSYVERLPNVEVMVHFLKQIKDFTREERKEILEILNSYKSALDINYDVDCIKLLIESFPEPKKHSMNYLRSSLEEIFAEESLLEMSDIERESIPIIYFVCGLFSTDVEEFVFLCNDAMELFRTVFFKEENLENVSDEEVVDTFRRKVISYLIENNESRAEKIHNKLLSLLNEMENPKTSKFLVDFIFTNYEEIGINEDHALFQKTIEMKSLLEEDLENNSFKIFQTHKNLENKKIVCTPLPQMLNKKKVLINIKKFQNGFTERIYKREELPKGITANSLGELFENFDLRLFCLAEVIKGRTLKSVRENFGERFTNIRLNMVGEDSILSESKLQYALEKKELPTYVFLLFAIIKYIKDQPDSITKGEMLTKQEEVLLGMSASIWGCETGKQEGIYLAYKQLPEAYKYSFHEGIEENSVERGQTYVKSLVYSELESIFSSHNNFILDVMSEFDEEGDVSDSSDGSDDESDVSKVESSNGEESEVEEGIEESDDELSIESLSLNSEEEDEGEEEVEERESNISIGQDPYAQLAHTSLYLKNLIGKKVGLNHQITFDINAEIIKDELLNRSPEDVLNLFYKNFTPSYLVYRLEKVINRDVKQVKSLFNDLSKILENSGSSLGIEQIWKIDDDTNEFKITKKGILELLCAQEYLTGVS